MIRRIDLRGPPPAPSTTAKPCRAPTSTSKRLSRRCTRSARRPGAGLDAIREYGESFDGVDLADIRVPADARRCAREARPRMRAALDESIRRLRATCAAELERDVVTELGPGARVTHRKVPVDRVGLYVPGGLAPLVSSVLMNVVPAQIAGVESIALSSSRSATTAARCTPRSWRRARCSGWRRCTRWAGRRR